MKTTFTLVMLTRDPVMGETSADVFCQSERADRIERVADAMRKEYVSDFRIVTQQGRRVTQGPLLRSYKVNECPMCRRQYTYNELQDAREAGQVEFGDLLCECGCTFMIDWQFKGTPLPIVVVNREALAKANEEAREAASKAPCIRCSGTGRDSHDYTKTRPCPLCQNAGEEEPATEPAAEEATQPDGLDSLRELFRF